MFGALWRILIDMLLLHMILQLHSVRAIGVAHFTLEMVLLVLVFLKKHLGAELLLAGSAGSLPL